jgi:hypothetical protein
VAPLQTQPQDADGAKHAERQRGFEHEPGTSASESSRERPKRCAHKRGQPTADGAKQTER